MNQCKEERAQRYENMVIMWSLTENLREKRKANW